MKISKNTFKSLLMILVILSNLNVVKSKYRLLKNNVKERKLFIPALLGGLVAPVIDKVVDVFDGDSDEPSSSPPPLPPVQTYPIEKECTHYQPVNRPSFRPSRYPQRRPASNRHNIQRRRSGGQSRRSGGQSRRSGGKSRRSGGKSRRSGGQSRRSGGQSRRSGGQSRRSGGSKNFPRTKKRRN